jgi:DNA-binding beta-propeller fold protein YncE
MHTCKLFIALGAFAISGWAQTSAGVAGPVTGFIFDAQTGAVRPMLGIPGAAYLGNMVAPGLNSASVAPDGSAALAVQQLGRLVLYTGLRGATPPLALHVPGAIAGADHFAWAPISSANGGGSAAVVYCSRTGQAQILTGLGQSPAAAAPINLSGLPGQVTALAFDGQRLIVGVASNEAGGIYLASASSGIQRIAHSASPCAIDLAGSSLYFADNQAQQIWQVQSYAGIPAAVLFANDSGISSPAGLQLSADGQRLYAANAGNRTLSIYDITSRLPVQSLDLSFTPTRLDLFGDATTFLLNGTGQGPLYVVRDGAPGKAAVYFVPAVPGKPSPLKAPIRPT